MPRQSQAASTSDLLSSEEGEQLLIYARQALESWINEGVFPHLDLKDVRPHLRQLGSSFITLTIDERLRGCVGALEPTMPLAQDVQQHAIAAATQDFRFPPVQPFELSEIAIEVSCLTTPKLLEYDSPDDLLQLLRPNIDGVVMMDGTRRATFLPQVWQKIPDHRSFLKLLCQKMGSPPDTWFKKKLKIFTYQVQEFHEGE
jgi:AmmeMemoRadiSam system protein A